MVEGFGLRGLGFGGFERGLTPKPKALGLGFGIPLRRVKGLGVLGLLRLIRSRV